MFLRQRFLGDMVEQKQVAVALVDRKVTRDLLEGDVFQSDHNQVWATGDSGQEHLDRQHIDVL